MYIQHTCSRSTKQWLNVYVKPEKTCLKCWQHLPENNVIFWLGCFNWLELCCPLSSIQKTPQRMYERSNFTITPHIATVCMRVKTVSLCRKERLELSTWQVKVWGLRGSGANQSQRADPIKHEFWKKERVTILTYYWILHSTVFCLGYYFCNMNLD